MTPPYIVQILGNDDRKKRKIEEMMDDVVLLPPASLPGRQENQPTMEQAADPMTQTQFEIAHHDEAGTRTVNFYFDSKKIQDLLTKGKSLVIEEGRGYVTWFYDSEGCTFVKELLEAPEVRVVDNAIDIDNADDIHYYKLTSGLDEDMDIDPILISRHHSRGVVKAIQDFQSDKTFSVSQLVGPPGIGKSRSLMLLLREHLLSKTKTSARFYLQKAKVAFWFIRIDSKLWCFSADVFEPVGRFMTHSLEGTMFDKSLVLLDPQEAENGGAQYAPPRSVHLVVACSDNNQHFPHGRGKLTSERVFYLGLWTRVELRQAYRLGLFRVVGGRNALENDFTSETIDIRANYVGEAPRYIFDLDKFRTRLMLIEDSTKHLSEEIVSVSLSKGPGALQGCGTLAGRFFARENVDSSDYRVSTVKYLSRFSLFEMYNRYRNNFLSTMKHCGGNNPGYIFEVLAGWDLHTGGDFMVYNLDYRKKLKEGCTVDLKKQIKTKFLLPDTPTEITRRECVQKVLKEGSCPAAPGASLIGLSKCYPAIDYVGKGRKVYQATVQEDHKQKGWLDLLVDAGILESTKPPLQVCSGAEKLYFYWVVPSWKAQHWIDKKAKKLQANDCSLKGDNLEHANKIIEEYVVQKVILIPTELSAELEP